MEHAPRHLHGHGTIDDFTNWLAALAPTSILSPDEGGTDAAEGFLGDFVSTLRKALSDERLFLTYTNRGLRSSLGPMVVLLQPNGAVIAGVRGPLSPG